MSLHTLTVYTARGGGPSVLYGVSDPVGGMAAYTNVVTVGSAGVHSTGKCAGPGKEVPKLYNSLTAPIGIVTSHTGRPGPNVGLVGMVNETVVSVPANIAAVMVVVTSGRTPGERVSCGKFLSSGVRLGVTVGSAGAMLVRGHTGAGGVPTTGAAVGSVGPRGAITSKCPSWADDFRDAPGAYGARGTAGRTTIGTPVVSLSGGAGPVEGAMTGY